MEGDEREKLPQNQHAYFNPLPPHGGRLKWHFTMIWDWVFQSTPSAWRETSSPICNVRLIQISIHSLRMEGDFGAR